MAPGRIFKVAPKEKTPPQSDGAVSRILSVHSGCIKVRDFGTGQRSVPNTDVLDSRTGHDVDSESVWVSHSTGLGSRVALYTVGVERERRAVVRTDHVTPLLRRDLRTARGVLEDPVVGASVRHHEHPVEVVDRTGQVAPAAVQLGHRGRTREERDA